VSVRDSRGQYLDGGKTFSITLPGPVPAGQFWSFTVYDSQTRSLLETDQKLAGVWVDARPAGAVNRPHLDRGGRGERFVGHLSSVCSSCNSGLKIRSDLPP